MRDGSGSCPAPCGRSLISQQSVLEEFPQGFSSPTHELMGSDTDRVI